MRIGLNCLRTAPNYKGGINSFTFGLLEGLAANQRGHEYVIFAGPHNRHMFTEFEARGNFSVEEINETSFGEDRQAIDKLDWRIRYKLPFPYINRLINDDYARMMDARADVHYVPYSPPPLFPYPTKPTIYSIHDIQQNHYPDFFSPEQLAERAVCFNSCVEHAALIQASSTHMLEDFVAHFPSLSRERVVVIREGVDVDEFAKAPEPNDVRQRHNLPDRFLFYPAQLWHHKNHITVLKALTRLRARGLNVPLVLTGAKYPGASDAIFAYIEQNELSRDVHYLGLVERSDIIALYHAARFLITAVLYESSSIPILEAAAAGTPVIASRTPPNVERTEDLQMQLFAPTDEAELAEVIASVWKDDGRIRTQVAHNKRAIERFRWSAVADDYVTMFEGLAGRAGARAPSA